MIRINKKAVEFAKRLIKEGKVDIESDWSFEPEDENKILGDGNWDEYEKWFLGVDTDANPETKARYKFPFGKDGKVYRRALIAAKVRAAQFGYKNIYNTADELLQMIEEKYQESFTITGELRSALDENAGEYEVTIISVGESKTYPRFFYSAEVLQSAAPNFEGVQVFAHSQGPHVDADKKSVRDIVGWIDNVRFEGDELRGILHLLPSASWIRENLTYAFKQNKTDIYELSIDALGRWTRQNGKNIALSIDKVLSVDIVPRGARGGRFVRILNSENQKQITEATMIKEILVQLKAQYPQLFEGIDLEAEDIDFESIFKTIIEKLQAQSQGTQTQTAENYQALIDELSKIKSENEALKKQFGLMRVEEKLSRTTLPDKIKNDLRDKYMKGKMTEAEVDEQIRILEESFSSVRNTQPAPFIRFGLDKRDKAQFALEGLFESLSVKPLTEEEIKTKYQGVRPYTSLKEAYIDFTGDIYFKGHFREATLSDWANALGNAMNRLLVRDYGEMALDTWREFVDIVPLSDFRKVTRVRIAGWGNLQTVAENSVYPNLTGGSEDAVVEYAPIKKGGLISVTWEMIRNDDIGAIKSAVKDLARAAAQTLHEFVYDFISPAVNPTIYDGVSLYHNSHNNLLTSALAEGSLATARLKLKKQTRPGANKPLGLRARYLVVPSDLEHTAYGLVTASYGQYNETPSFLQTQGIKVITVDYWTDANDWVLVADKRDITGLEIGFLDGKEVPELLVQDVNAGDWFNKDAMTYKVRFVFGGAVIDYRAFVGAIVP